MILFLVCRYHAALSRYLSGEEESQSPGEVREVSARSVPSASSHKQVWEGLEDIGTIRTRENRHTKVLQQTLLNTNHSCLFFRKIKRWRE